MGLPTTRPKEHVTVKGSRRLFGLAAEEYIQGDIRQHGSAAKKQENEEWRQGTDSKALLRISKLLTRQPKIANHLAVGQSCPPPSSHHTIKFELMNR
jgi:hypothetical protein